MMEKRGFMESSDNMLYEEEKGSWEVAPLPELKFDADEGSDEDDDVDNPQAFFICCAARITTFGRNPPAEASTLRQRHLKLGTHCWLAHMLRTNAAPSYGKLVVPMFLDTDLYTWILPFGKHQNAASGSWPNQGRPASTTVPSPQPSPSNSHQVGAQGTTSQPAALSGETAAEYPPISS